MKLPSEINKEKIYDFFIKLKSEFNLNKELITHIKFSEYSISIPEKENEFYSFFEEHNWNDIFYISFFIKQNFFINFDFIEDEIKIKCENMEVETKLRDFLNSYFNL